MLVGRARLCLWLVVFGFPGLPLACTSDQFSGVDSGDGGGGGDAPADQARFDAGGGLDAPMTLDSGKGDAVGLPDGCPDASINLGSFTCGNNTCSTALQFCDDVTKVCQQLPASCVCNHTCGCVTTHLSGFCDGGATPTCTTSGGGNEITLSCP